MPRVVKRSASQAVKSGASRRNVPLPQFIPPQLSQPVESLPRVAVRKWVREFGADPKQAFPGHGQMKPEQLEIDRLRRAVAKLKAERAIVKKAAACFPREST